MDIIGTREINQIIARSAQSKDLIKI